jgi:hypothetical protein
VFARFWLTRIRSFLASPGIAGLWACPGIARSRSSQHADFWLTRIRWPPGFQGIAGFWPARNQIVTWRRRAIKPGGELNHITKRNGSVQITTD